MSDPRETELNLTGMLPNGSFGETPDAPSTGEGDDVITGDYERGGEPDIDINAIETGQD
jgi:hypothetical protein